MTKFAVNEFPLFNNFTPVNRVLQQILEINNVVKEIDFLRRELNAVILSHNYQIQEIQEIADFTGDSLELSRFASKTSADIVVFCGVRFMAETASIINPDKKILIPDKEAGCSLSDTITVDQLRKWKEMHPSAVVVSYVNTSAEVKAESDYCCTSSNLLKVIDAIPKDQDILFLPDMFLGAYAETITQRMMKVWPGECHVHAAIRPEDISAIKSKHPKAELLIHPECGCVSQCIYYSSSGDIDSADISILSTGGMLDRAKNSNAKEFLVATEIGMIPRMAKDNPGKKFYPVREDAICKYMKMISLDKVCRSLRYLQYEVKVDEDIAKKAKIPIERMLKIT